MIRAARKSSEQQVFDEYQWLYEKDIPATLPFQTLIDDSALMIRAPIPIYTYTDNKVVRERIIPVPEIDEFEEPLKSAPREIETNSGVFVTNCIRLVDQGKEALQREASEL